MATRSITLGEANTNPLDLTDAASVKLYKKAMHPLEGEKYDTRPWGLRAFLKEFETRASMFNWWYILNVPDFSQVPVNRNFFQNYGSVTLEECQAHAEAYLLVKGRPAQDPQMMVNCLIDSLTKEAKAEMFAKTDKYKISGYADGLCFLKVLVSKAQLETIAFVNMLQAMINKFPMKIVELNGNITEFNNHVKEVEVSLFFYGEKALEMLMHVFLAYKEVEDEDFIQYIKIKKIMWEEGGITLDLNKFLSNAENNYKIRMQQGKWNALLKG
jgi:hypothetical protein